MRISAHKDDPGYTSAVFGAVVTVDGVKTDMCIMADEELGEVMCLSLPPPVGESQDGLIIVSKRGKVVITMPSVI